MHSCIPYVRAPVQSYALVHLINGHIYQWGVTQSVHRYRCMISYDDWSGGRWESFLSNTYHAIWRKINVRWWGLDSRSKIGPSPKLYHTRSSPLSCSIYSSRIRLKRIRSSTSMGQTGPSQKVSLFYHDFKRNKFTAHSFKWHVMLNIVILSILKRPPSDACRGLCRVAVWRPTSN